jgi:thiol-disulfide isomerase/thioredoxin
MHRLTLSLALLALAACSQQAPAPARPVVAAYAGKAKPGETVPVFQASVRRGSTTAAFDSQATKTATVYVVENAVCPACQTYAPRLAALEKGYAGKPVDFVHVYPKLDASNAKDVAWHDGKGFAGGQMLDPDGAVSKAFQATRTPEIIVADAKGTVVYRGAVDDSMDASKVKDHYVSDAIDATLANDKVANPETPPVG